MTFSRVFPIFENDNNNDNDNDNDNNAISGVGIDLTHSEHS